MTNSWNMRASWLALLAAGALGLALAAAPAAAQGDEYQGDQGDQYDEQYQDQDDMAAPDDTDAAYDEDTAEPDEMAAAEEVEVFANRPRLAPGQHIGVPADTMTMSREVAYDDLDLTTREGARELRERVRLTADDVCGELASYDPPSDADYGPCYHKAVGQGLRRANAAIARARNYAWAY